MTILKHDGTPAREATESCDHGVTFDHEKAAEILGSWAPSSPEEFVMGNPAVAEIRRRWPRLNGPCPLGCGYVGVYYASFDHYTSGGW